MSIAWQCRKQRIGGSALVGARPMRDRNLGAATGELPRRRGANSPGSADNQGNLIILGNRVSHFGSLDRGHRKRGFAGFHDEFVVERIPRRLHMFRRRGAGIVPPIVADQRTGHTENNVA